MQQQGAIGALLHAAHWHTVGTSPAAVTLVVLNCFCDLDLSHMELTILSGRLSTDESTPVMNTGL